MDMHNPRRRREQMIEPTGKLKFAYQTIKELEAKVMAAHTTVTRLTEKLADYEDACRQKQEIIDTESCLVADYLLMRRGLEFYAKKDRYSYDYPSTEEDEFILRDNGETAREILEKTK